MEFWTTEPRISDAIEALPGHEEGNWTQLKKDLIAKWGRVEPERRYRKDSLIELFNDTQEDGGIGSLSQYKKCMGEYEAIVTYILRYRYIPKDNMFHEDLFDCLSADIKGAINEKISPKKLVEDFANEQEELTKIRKENEAKESTLQSKEVNIIQAKKNDISTAIAKIEDWGSWKTPTISSANDPFLNNYGLRNNKQRSSRNEHPSEEPTKSLLKTMKTPLKNKPNIPGAYIEDEHGTVEETIIPNKFKKPQEFKGEEEVIPEVKEKQDS
ncbi:hypothetical protein O181_067134 [Austropuccinia psidii MF-1]|uniref:Uncharacterized protein n=1 Tax=Austropuccinia psidii MF-1 TaxID=1389203 RepID=A0A9Q3EUT4_9BASI|nr:hypothetical protein [Austropuccinia psidii MF-1]